VHPMRQSSAKEKMMMHFGITLGKPAPTDHLSRRLERILLNRTTQVGAFSMLCFAYLVKRR
jgi:hypothetical protein